MLKLAVCVSGGGTNLQAIIDRIEDGTIQGARIVRVISNNPRAYALERAKQAGIEGICVSPRQYETRDLFNQALLEALQAAEPDLIVLAGFMTILTERFTSHYPERILNVHPSLIPSFCGEGFYGLKVHEEALKYGVKVTGATVHFVNEIPDGGEIIAQKAVYIEEGDTPEILQRRVMEQAEWILLPQAAEKVCANLQK